MNAEIGAAPYRPERFARHARAPTRADGDPKRAASPLRPPPRPGTRAAGRSRAPVLSHLIVPPTSCRKRSIPPRRQTSISQYAMTARSGGRFHRLTGSAAVWARRVACVMCSPARRPEPGRSPRNPHRRSDRSAGHRSQQTAVRLSASSAQASQTRLAVSSPEAIRRSAWPHARSRMDANASATEPYTPGSDDEQERRSRLLLRDEWSSLQAPPADGSVGARMDDEEQSVRGVAPSTCRPGRLRR
jgi:hypothetical protein